MPHAPNKESQSTTLRDLKDPSPKEVSLKKNKFGIGKKDKFHLISNPLFEIEANEVYDNPLFELNQGDIHKGCDEAEDNHRTWDPKASPINKELRQTWNNKGKPSNTITNCSSIIFQEIEIQIKFLKKIPSFFQRSNIESLSYNIYHIYPTQNSYCYIVMTSMDDQTIFEPLLALNELKLRNHTTTILISISTTKNDHYISNPRNLYTIPSTMLQWLQ